MESVPKPRLSPEVRRWRNPRPLRTLLRAARPDGPLHPALPWALLLLWALTASCLAGESPFGALRPTAHAKNESMHPKNAARHAKDAATHAKNAAAPADSAFTLPDSLAADSTRAGSAAPGDTTGPEAEEFNPATEETKWDSTMAEIGEPGSHRPAREVAPKFGIGYSKVEGLHLELGAARGYLLPHVSYLEARPGYDFSRKKATGHAVARIHVLNDERLRFELTYRYRAVPFGNYDPYGNGLLALFAGYDARRYLLEQSGTISLVWNFTEERQVGLGWMRARQDSLRPLADPLIVRETREGLNDVVALVVDRTQSQDIGTRRADSERALNAMRDKLKAIQ